MSQNGAADSTQPGTLPQYLLLNARRFADRPAMRQKDLGIWQSWTWAGLKDEIAAYSLGLSKLGLKAGDVGSGRFELVFLLAQLVFGRASPLFKLLGALVEQVRTLAGQAQPLAHLVDLQLQVGRIS